MVPEGGKEIKNVRREGWEGGLSDNVKSEFNYWGRGVSEFFLSLPIPF